LEIVHESARRFKQSISLGDVTGALEALLPAGIMTGPSPKEELEKLELEAARTSHRVLFLPNRAKLALWAGDTDKAERYASEALHSIAGRDIEEAVHDGNMVLGLIALRQRDKDRAKEYLLEVEISVPRQAAAELALDGIAGPEAAGGLAVEAGIPGAREDPRGHWRGIACGFELAELYCDVREALESVPPQPSYPPLPPLGAPPPPYYRPPPPAPTVGAPAEGCFGKPQDGLPPLGPDSSALCWASLEC
jgi:hypothetical protein